MYSNTKNLKGNTANVVNIHPVPLRKLVEMENLLLNWIERYSPNLGWENDKNRT